MPPKSGKPEKAERFSRGIIKNTAKKISKITPRHTPKSTPRNTPINTPKSASAEIANNTPGPDGKGQWPLFEGLKTVQIDNDPYAQHNMQDLNQRPTRVYQSYGPSFRPTHPYAQPYARPYPQQYIPYIPVRQAPKLEPYTMSSLAQPIPSDPRNGPIDMMYNVYQAKIRNLEEEVMKLQREKEEIQKSKDELIEEFQKVSALVDVALGAKVERRIGRK